MGVTYNKLISEYEGDLTKECGLTINEVDNNFYFLRGADIKSVNTNEEKTLLIFEYVNGVKMEVPISQEFSEINERIDDIIDEIVELGNKNTHISEHINNLYEQLGFDEENKFMPCHPPVDGEQEKCTIYIRDCESVNEALLVLDNALAEVDGKYGEDIDFGNELLKELSEKVNTNIENIGDITTDIETLKEQDKVLQKHIDDEITLRDSNDIRIEKEYKASDEYLRNEISAERNERIEVVDNLRNNIADINDTISKIEDSNNITNLNITDLYNKVIDVNSKLNVNDGINKEQNDKINSSFKSIEEINGTLKTLEEIVKGYQSAIQVLNDRCNVLESENTNLRSKIEEIIENGGLIDQCRINAVEDAKREIISSDVFKSEGTEIAVNVESGTVKIGFAESLFLGV